MDRIKITYEGRVIYNDLSLEEASEILESIAEDFYDGSDIDPSKIKLEPIN
jgi:hypothetical protein